MYFDLLPCTDSVLDNTSKYILTCLWLIMQTDIVFTARRSYASAVLGVVILSVRTSHACFVTNRKNLPAIFLYHMKARAILLVKCDFSYSCAAADKISTDLRARAVSLRQLSYLFYVCSQNRAEYERRVREQALKFRDQSMA